MVLVTIEGSTEVGVESKQTLFGIDGRKAMSCPEPGSIKDCMQASHPSSLDFELSESPAMASRRPVLRYQ